MRAAVVSPDGAIAASRKVPVADRAPESVADLAAKAAAEATEACGDRAIAATGVSLAAQLRGRTGVVEIAPNLGWREVPFGELFAARLGQPVRVFNDLSAAAWAEHRLGAGRGASDLLAFFVGSGVGGALIVGGRLAEGATGVAGEVGHVKVVPGGRRCGCGDDGCLEAYAGGLALVARVEEATAAGRPSALRGAAGPLTPADVERAAIEGDALAVETWDEAARHLGAVLGNLITVLNPARVVLGGGVLSTCARLRERLKVSAPLIAGRAASRAVVIVDAALGDDAGAVGAALLAAATPARGASGPPRTP